MNQLSNPNSSQTAGALSGKTIVVTRARDQAQRFAARLEAQGASVLFWPLIDIVEPEDWAPADVAIENLTRYDWVIFTSQNAVERFWSRVEHLRKNDGVSFPGRVAAVGPATAEKLRQRGVKVDFVPSHFQAESLVEEFPETALGKRILFPRGDLARDVIAEGLRARGATVDDCVVYRTRAAKSSRAEWAQSIRDRRIDVVTFASPSAVENFVALFDQRARDSFKNHFYVASLGAVTSAKLRAHGFRVDIEPTVSTREAFADAIADFLKERL